MPNIFFVPEEEEQDPLPEVNIAPGPYWAEIVAATASSKSKTKLAVLYRIVDDDNANGTQIWENFNLKYKKGRKLFEEFLEATGIGRGMKAVDLDGLKGKMLCITVERNGQWTNVIEHRPELF